MPVKDRKECISEEARSFAEATVLQLAKLKKDWSEHEAAQKHLKDIEDRAAVDGLPLLEKIREIRELANKRKLSCIAELAKIEGKAHAEILAGIREMAREKREEAEDLVAHIEATTARLKTTLHNAGWRHIHLLDHLDEKLQETLEGTFNDNPDLAPRLFEGAHWPLPVASADQVLAQELQEINALRKKRGLKEAQRNELFGLALSGGGIRSATFGLGVLQGLAKFDLLKRVDILSTVSGGGYIGSWLAAWINREKIDVVQSELAASGELDQGGTSPTPISFLREFSNYLTPDMGIFSLDTWTMGALYLRNVLLNQLILVGIIGALMLVPRFAVWPLMQAGGSDRMWAHNWIILTALLLAGVSVSLVCLNLNRVTGGSDERDTDRVEPSEHRGMAAALSSLSEVGVQGGCVVPMIGAVVLASIWFWLNIDHQDLRSIGNNAFWWCAGAFFFVLSFLITLFCRSFLCVKERLLGKKNKTAWILFRYFLLLVATALSAGVAIGLLRGYLLILATFHASPPAGQWHTVVWAPVLLMLVLGTAAILHVGLLGTYMRDVGREWLTRFRAITHMWLFFWTALCCAEIYGPLMFAKIGKYAIGGVSLAWVTSTVGSLIAGRSAATAGKSEESGKPRSSILEMVAKIGPPTFVVGFLLFLSLAEHLLLSYPKNCGMPFTLTSLIDNHWNWLEPTTPPDSLWPLLTPVSLFLILAGTGVLLAWRVDINEFSMHRFYKNRLVRCYLGASNRGREPNAFTKFDPNDDVRLCDLKAAKGYTGPYHILNTTLNLSAGGDLAWQERKGASFIFTPAYCGFDYSLETENTGRRRGDRLTSRAYRDARNYAYPGGVPLGTAMAISGAAADPNMGYNTSSTVAFLMTVFDVRLGWWLGNPRRNAKSALPGPVFGLGSLISELLGRTTDQSNFVSLSDGGHFDNMGLYELVRRRCGCIILCDGEQDGEYKFEGLGGAIRKCRIDFGAQIEIDPKAIVPSGDGGRSEAHCAVGTIRYADGTEGILLYIKSSLTGDEPTDVLQYASTAPDFPHQTTADQWFSESQFESYRALGYQAVQAAIKPAQNWIGQKKLDDVALLFREGLKNYWYPANPGLRENALKHTGTLSELLTQIARDKELHALGQKLFSVSDKFGPGRDHKSQEFYFVMVLLQLVEDVYFDFQLDRSDRKDDPRIAGWRKLFEEWANAEIVREVWRCKRDSFREDFQRFWESLEKEEGPEEPAPPRPHRQGHNGQHVFKHAAG